MDRYRSPPLTCMYRPPYDGFDSAGLPKVLSNEDNKSGRAQTCLSPRETTIRGSPAVREIAVARFCLGRQTNTTTRSGVHCMRSKVAILVLPTALFIAGTAPD